MNQITIENGVSFELNQSNFTAKIVYSPKARGNVFLPRSIEYQAKEYIITHIEANAFRSNTRIKKLSFSDDSSLISIAKKSFRKSSIKSITLPPSVEELQEGWCSCAFYLNNVTISPKNPNFKYLDEKHQIIVGKSDKKSENFDVIVFASREINEATIPPYIKHISSFSFNVYEKLQTVFISEKSMLHSIGKKSFSLSLISHLYIPSCVEELQDGWCCETSKLTNVVISPTNPNFKYMDEKRQIVVGKSDKKSENFDVIVFASREINKVTIPSHIKRIGSFSFDECISLQTVTFSENSQLQSIGKKAFSSSRISHLHIPSSVEELHKDWCLEMTKLKKVTISSENPNFKYLDENQQIIVGKSDKSSENFDVIVFADRGISAVKIPPNIQRINSFAFYKCELLKKIQIPKNSELKTIGTKAFSNSAIERIMIPKNVETIGRFAFSYCKKLKEASFNKGSKLRSIPNCMFYNSNMFKKIEIPEDSELKTIGKSPFAYTKIEKIFVPPKVEVLLEGWLDDTTELVEVLISPKNHFLMFLDVNHQIIRGMNDDKLDTIVYCRKDIINVKVPFYIKYITKQSFGVCKALKRIEFPENSELEIIEDCAFQDSLIEWINIPSSLKELQEGWCSHLTKLKNVVISPKNENYKYLDDEQKIIVGKSDKTKDIFDIIVFATRDIEEAKIPSYIKRIDSYAFAECKFLVKIEFQENSELYSIGAYSFSSSKLTKIKIPKSVEIIENNAFAFCLCLEEVVFEKGSKLKSIQADLFTWGRNLKTIEIPEDSSIESICKHSFVFNKIQKLYIPAKCLYLYDGFCFNCLFLNEITVAENNPFLKNCDENKKLILGKRDTSSESFDVIVYACNDITEVKIPFYIKDIKSFAFANCSKIKKLDFQSNSQLETIGQCSFNNLLVKNLALPSKVYKIKKSSFEHCQEIKHFEFLGDFLLNKLDFLKKSRKLMLASFPNLHEITVKSKDFRYISADFSLFICAGAKLNFID